MSTPPTPPPLPAEEEQLTAALDRFIRNSIDPTEPALVAALIQFIPSVACPDYLRDAAEAWLRAKTRTFPET